MSNSPPESDASAEVNSESDDALAETGIAQVVDSVVEQPSRVAQPEVAPETKEAPALPEALQCPETQSDSQQRSLSLPKSFLATKYGLVGLKAALPR